MRCLVSRRPSSADRSTPERRIRRLRCQADEQVGRFDSTVQDPLLDIVGLKTYVAPYLHERNPALMHESANETFPNAQPAGEAADVDQPLGRCSHTPVREALGRIRVIDTTARASCAFGLVWSQALAIISKCLLTTPNGPSSTND